ncbi:MAG TPA: RagB/SusD family nutrient uptake outer membrane protein [Gemmatimonadales bacterium]|nr:RagB/SusD family nutrient uptake outer membrane protein [Gemmatimonadales bacterium]
MRTRLFAALAGLLVVGACSFDILNTNQPTQDDLINNPTRDKLAAAATGLFASARTGIQGFIWRLGSMGREGINLSGNNQPDFIEPYFGPINGGGSFGGTQWGDRYAAIRSGNIYLAALANDNDLSAAEKSASSGFAKTLNALALLYIVEARAQLGAPVDVGHDVAAGPAPFVSEDSVYGYMLGLLTSAQSDLAAGGSGFPFPVPPGFAGFDTPATFILFNRALAAKVYSLRATAGCGGNAATCYTAALTALAGSFIDPTPAAFSSGVFFDYSTAPGDAQNTLSDPPTGLTFFALQDNITDADTQTTGLKDQRVLDKLMPAVDTQLLSAIADIPGELKFTVFMTGGAADPGHSIPIIRDEELVLLRAEAEWFTGAKAAALTDLNLVRQNSGALPASTVGIGDPDAAFVTALLYERRFSLLWEQGTRWIDARRFGRLAGIPPAAAGGNVVSVMPIPKSECDAIGLSLGPLSTDPNVVTCTPLAP